MSNEDAQSLAQEIIGDLGDLAVAGQIECAMGTNGFIDRIGIAGLVEGVEVRLQKHLVAGIAFHVQRGLQAHDAFGQGAGLVGADHVYAAEVLDGSQPFHDHLGLRHPLGTSSDRLMLMIAGNNCGVSPTASANEKSTDSRTGRWRYRLMAKMTITSTSVTSMRK